MAITIETGGAADRERCPCCGGRTRRVWGHAYRDRVGEAAYFVGWTMGHVEQHGARFDLILGPWGDDASVEDRIVVGLEWRITEQGPAFMVIDATHEGFEGLAARALRRDQVVGTAVAGRVFEIVDAVWLQDARITELTSRDS